MGEIDPPCTKSIQDVSKVDETRTWETTVLRRERVEIARRDAPLLIPDGNQGNGAERRSYIRKTFTGSRMTSIKETQ
jgi:hypothetical protein